MNMFRAMDTDVRLLLPRVEPEQAHLLTERAQAIFESAERTFSRFRPESELSRLNASHGPTVVSETLFDALERARQYWALTGGWFDVTIEPVLRAAGYDRSFVKGSMDRMDRSTSVAAPPRPVTSAQVLLDRATRSVELLEGARIDCGGFIKGWVVDQVLAVLPDPSAIDAGGDAAMRGGWPYAKGWEVGVEDPCQPGHALVCLRARDRAVATSGINRRRWRVGADEAHHLINPHTARPATVELVQVSVLAPLAELADVLAKTVFLRGERDGLRFLRRFEDVAAVLVRNDGSFEIYGEVNK
jgi:thiamine biosynthesis lipoprotein